MFSDLQSLVTSIMNSIYCGTSVAHIATKYYLAADMARDGEIDLNYVPAIEMLTNCFTKPLPTPAFLKHCAAMRMIGNGLGIGLSTIGHGLRNSHQIGNGTGNGIGNAVRM